MELVNYNAVPSRKNKSRSPLVEEQLFIHIFFTVSSLVSLQPVVAGADFYLQWYAVG
jgi:hypothetical protein